MGNTHDTEIARIEADHIQTKWLTSHDYRWGYTTERGPDTWWMHHPSASGGMQSPINILTEEAKMDSDLASNLLRINYRARSFYSTSVDPSAGSGGGGGGRPSGDGAPSETVVLTNTGNTLQLNIINSQSYITGGPCREYSYVLDQVHIHWGSTNTCGSEHTVNSQAYAAEVQLVHWNEDLFCSYEDAEKSDGGLVILTVFVQISENKCNEALEELGRLSEDVPYRNQNVPARELHIRSLLPDSTQKFWTYEGSMTMPPCYETVTWIIFEKPISIRSQILEKFRRIRCYCDNEVRPINDDFDGYVITNRRPAQPIGTRAVCYVDGTQQTIHYDHVRKRLQPFRDRWKAAPAGNEALQGPGRERGRDGAAGRRRSDRGCNRG